MIGARPGDVRQLVDAKRWERLPETQTEQVAAHLLAFGTITPMEALRVWGIMRLGARIHELRKAGLAITTRWIETKPGTHVARYTLDGTD